MHILRHLPPRPLPPGARGCVAEASGEAMSNSCSTSSTSIQTAIAPDPATAAGIRHTSC